MWDKPRHSYTDDKMSVCKACTESTPPIVNETMTLQLLLTLSESAIALSISRDEQGDINKVYA